MAQEFWDYDIDACTKAEQISGDIRALKKAKAAARLTAKGKVKSQ